MTESQWACLGGAARDGGYHMYAQAQRTIALGLRKLGLVEIDDEGSGAFGRVVITDAGRDALKGAGHGA